MCLLFPKPFLDATNKFGGGGRHASDSDVAQIRVRTRVFSPFDENKKYINLGIGIKKTKQNYNLYFFVGVLLGGGGVCWRGGAPPPYIVGETVQLLNKPFIVLETICQI